MKERVKILEITVQQLTAQLQETRAVLEKLAAISGLEYSRDVQDWVGKGRLEALRREPR